MSVAGIPNAANERRLGEIKGTIKAHWDRLIDDQLDSIDGKRGRPISNIQETYGASKNKVEKHISDWQKRQRESNHPA